MNTFSTVNDNLVDITEYICITYDETMHGTTIDVYLREAFINNINDLFDANCMNMFVWRVYAYCVCVCVCVCACVCVCVCACVRACVRA